MGPQYTKCTALLRKSSSRTLFRLFQHVPGKWNRRNPASMRVAGPFLRSVANVPVKNYIYGGEKFIYNTEKTCCHVMRKGDPANLYVPWNSETNETPMQLFPCFSITCPRTRPTQNSLPRNSPERAIVPFDNSVINPARPQYTKCTALFLNPSSRFCNPTEIFLCHPSKTTANTQTPRSRSPATCQPLARCPNGLSILVFHTPLCACVTHGVIVTHTCFSTNVQ